MGVVRYQGSREQGGILAGVEFQNVDEEKPARIGVGQDVLRTKCAEGEEVPAIRRVFTYA